MNDRFRVGVRTKIVPLRFELAAQVGEVVYLAVVGDPHASVFVAHGHVAIGGKIENGKAAAAEADVSAIGETALPEPGVVGSAMSLHVRHASQGFTVPAIR